MTAARRRSVYRGLEPRRTISVILAPLVALALALASCASTGEKIRDNPKTVLGSVLGAGAGAGIAAIAGGSAGVIVGSAVAGGLLGGYLGRRLDDRDKRMAAEAAQQAFETRPTGQSVAWTNPDSGNRGSVTPTRTYQLAGGQYCRQYRQDVWIGNEKHEATGTACRRADGTWETRS